MPPVSHLLQEVAAAIATFTPCPDGADTDDPDKDAVQGMGREVEETTLVLQMMTTETTTVPEVLGKNRDRCRYLDRLRQHQVRQAEVAGPTKAGTLVEEVGKSHHF
jgi:hypothetical protein